MIEIHKSKDGQFFVIYKGNNGEVIDQSETVKTKQSAKKNILAMAKIWGSIFSIVAFSSGIIPVTDYTLKKPKIIYI